MRESVFDTHRGSTGQLQASREHFMLNGFPKFALVRQWTYQNHSRNCCFLQRDREKCHLGWRYDVSNKVLSGRAK